VDDTGKIKQRSALEEYAPPSITDVPEFPDEWKPRIEELVNVARAQKKKTLSVAIAFCEELDWNLEIIREKKVLKYLQRRLRFKPQWPHVFSGLIKDGKVGNAKTANADRRILGVLAQADRVPRKIKDAILGCKINSVVANRQIAVGLTGDPDTQRSIREHQGEFEEALAKAGYPHQLLFQGWIRGEVGSGLPDGAGKSFAAIQIAPENIPESDSQSDSRGDVENGDDAPF
jgi:hypothetical protein